MARQTSRRRAWIGIGLVTGVAALSAGSWGLREWSPFGDDDAKVVWPENIQPIAEFVEETTGFQFRESVSIEYVEGRLRYEDIVNPTPAEPTPEDVEDAAVAAAAGRALGWWTGDVSLIEWDDTFATSAPGPVTWFGDDNSVVLRGSERDTTLDVSTRVDLAAVLTQVLDEQLFGVVEAANATDSYQRFQVYNGMLVGHALWVRDQYIDELDADETDEWFENLDEQNARYANDVDDIPAAFHAVRATGPAVGDGFMATIADDPAMVRAAFTSHVPEAVDQLMLPSTKYLRRDPAESVEFPAAPEGAEVKYTTSLGPVGLFLLMSTGLRAPEALTAADGWGGDAYTVYELDGVVCLDAHVVADSPDDADRIEEGLNAWALAREPESKALLGREGVNLYVSVCDPGTEVRQQIPDDEAINHLFGRSTELTNRISMTRKPALSECIAVRMFEEFSQVELNDFFENDIGDQIVEIEEACLDLE